MGLDIKDKYIDHFKIFKEYSKNIPNEISNFLYEYDFSNDHKYYEKMCELYFKHINLDIIKTIIHDYDLYSIYMDIEDISDKTYNQICADIEIAKIDASLNIKEDESIRNLLMSIDGVDVYEINDFYDAYKKGKSSQWCISLSKEMFLNHYENGDRFLILHNKNNVSFEYKILCAVYNINDKKCYITDKMNNDYYIYDLFDNILSLNCIQYIEEYFNKKYN